MKLLMKRTDGGFVWVGFRILLVILLSLFAVSLFSQTKLRDLEKATGQGFAIVSDANGKWYPKQYSEIQPFVTLDTIIYNPLDSGNIANNNQFVIDTNGDVFFIESLESGGKAIKLSGTYTQLTESEVDSMVNNNGYLTADKLNCELSLDYPFVRFWRLRGQSQNRGRAFNFNLPAIYLDPFSQVKIFDLTQNPDSFQPLQIGVNNYPGAGGNGDTLHGPELGMALHLMETCPNDTFYILKTAIGGTEIARHLPGGSEEDAYIQDSTFTVNAIAELIRNGRTPVVTDVWIQGESDTDTSKVYSHVDSMAIMLQNSRELMGVDLPMIVGEIGEGSDFTNNEERKVLNQNLRYFSKMNKGVHILKSAAYPRIEAGDSHFNYLGVRQIGKDIVNLTKVVGGVIIGDTLPMSRVLKPEPIPVLEDTEFLWSVKLYNTGYDGGAIRVRRSSDNTQSDIGYLSNDLDTITLKTFCGTTASDTCWIVTAYDQSGYSNDATQSTETSQPIILENGAIVRENGKPAMRFDSQDKYLQTGSFANGVISQANTSVAVAALNSSASSGSNYVLIDSDVSNRQFLSRRFTDNWSMHSGMPADGSSSDFNQNLFFADFDGVTSNLWINGSSVISNGLGGTNSLDELKIGSNGNSWWGTIQEVRIYNTDKTSDRAAIETLINDYFSIY